MSPGLHDTQIQGAPGSAPQPKTFQDLKLGLTQLEGINKNIKLEVAAAIAKLKVAIATDAIVGAISQVKAIVDLIRCLSGLIDDLSHQYHSILSTLSGAEANIILTSANPIVDDHKQLKTDLANVMQALENKLILVKDNNGNQTGAEIVDATLNISGGPLTIMVHLNGTPSTDVLQLDIGDPAIISRIADLPSAARTAATNVVKSTVGKLPYQDQIDVIRNIFPTNGEISEDSQLEVTCGYSPDDRKFETHLTFSNIWHPEPWNTNPLDTLDSEDTRLDGYEFINQSSRNSRHQFTVTMRREDFKLKNGTEAFRYVIESVAPVGFDINPRDAKQLKTIFKGHTLTPDVADQIVRFTGTISQSLSESDPKKAQENASGPTKRHWFNSSSTDRRVERIAEETETASDDATIARIQTRREQEEDAQAPSWWDRQLNRLGNASIFGKKGLLKKWFPSFFANSAMKVAGNQNPPVPGDNSDLPSRLPPGDGNGSNGNHPIYRPNRRQATWRAAGLLAGVLAIFGIRSATSEYDCSSTDSGLSSGIDAGVDAGRTASNAGYANNQIAADAGNTLDVVTDQAQRDAERELAEARMDAGAATREVQHAQSTLQRTNNAKNRGALHHAQNNLSAAHDRLARIQATITPPTTIGRPPQVPVPVTQNVRPITATTPSSTTTGPAAIVLPIGLDSGDVHGNTVQHPDRHNDSQERFLVHGARGILDQVQGLTPDQRTRAAGGIGHLMEGYVNRYLARHPHAAPDYGRIRYGDHGNMSVERVQVANGRGSTHEVVHIQLHRPGSHGGASRVVLDIQIPVSEIDNVLHAYGPQAAQVRTAGSGAHHDHRIGTTGETHTVRTTGSASRTGPSPQIPPRNTVRTPSVGTMVPLVENSPLVPAPTLTPDAIAPQPVPGPTVGGTAGTETRPVGTSAPSPDTGVSQPGPQAVTPRLVETPTPAPVITQPPVSEAPQTRTVPQQQQVASSPRLDTGRVLPTVETFGQHGFTRAQRQALAAAVREFNQQALPANRVVQVQASISYGDRYTDRGTTRAVAGVDPLNAPELDHLPATLTFQVINLPGVRQGHRRHTLEASLPIVVVRRSDGSMDLEVDTTNDGTRHVVLTRARESDLFDTRVTNRRLVPTLGSQLTGNVRWMAREEFRPTDDNQAIIDRVTTSIVGFGVEQSHDPDTSFALNTHTGSRGGPVYGSPTVGDHSPIAATLQYLLGQVVYVRYTPTINTDNGHGRVVTIHEGEETRVLHPFENSPERTDTVNALVRAIRTNLPRTVFTTQPQQTAPRPAPTPSTTPPVSRPAQEPQTGVTPGDILPDSIGDLVRNRVLVPESAEYTQAVARIDAQVARQRQVQRDVAITEDTATYEALLEDLDQFYDNNHNDTPQKAA